MKRKMLTGATAIILASLTLILLAPAPKSAGSQTSTLASTSAALTLAEHGLAGPAGPDDEGRYNLIDPIGPGGATPYSADNEVFAKTMIGGVYTRWQPYHDPFTSNGGYNGGPQGGLP